MADEAGVRSLIERDRVSEVINTLFVATDARDWACVRSCLAPVVTFDMTSLAGGGPQQLSPEQIVSGWETGLKPIESVHHQTGNLHIACTGAEATASCYGIAYHYRRTKSGDNTRVFVGSYDFHLRLQDAAWRIDLFRFNLKFIDGNRQLENEPGAKEKAMSPSKQTVQKYMDAFARSDHAEVLSCLTDDVEWVIPGAFHLTGKVAFDKEIENDAFVGRPSIGVTRMTEERDVVVAEGTVQCAKKDGGLLDAVFCDVFEMQGAKIRRLTSYVMELKG